MKGSEHTTVKIRLSQREIAHRRHLNEQVHVLLLNGVTWPEIASQWDVPKQIIHAVYTYQKIPANNTYRKKLGFPAIGARRYYKK